MTITLDGRITGPGGNEDMDWVLAHAFSDAARDLLNRAIGEATTALMGSINAEGYAAVWPAVADDSDADSRDRAFSRWLSSTEKVVFSSQGHSKWAQARIFDEKPADVVHLLQQEPGGDILILNSVSVIMPLLAAGLIDRFDLLIVPEILGAGRVLFESPLPPSSWTIESQSQSESGALAIRYIRAGD